MGRASLFCCASFVVACFVACFAFLLTKQQQQNASIHRWNTKFNHIVLLAKALCVEIYRLTYHGKSMASIEGQNLQGFGWLPRHDQDIPQVRGLIVEMLHVHFLSFYSASLNFLSIFSPLFLICHSAGICTSCSSWSFLRVMGTSHCHRCWWFIYMTNLVPVIWKQALFMVRAFVDYVCAAWWVVGNSWCY